MLHVWVCRVSAFERPVSFHSQTSLHPFVSQTNIYLECCLILCLLEEIEIRAKRQGWSTLKFIPVRSTVEHAKAHEHNIQSQ
jgi:hypothetical protein